MMHHFNNLPKKWSSLPKAERSFVCFADILSIDRKKLADGQSRVLFQTPSRASLLKKAVRYQIQDEVGEWDGQVWGFDFCEREINRAIKFRQQNPDTKPLFPLIERQISKQDALGMLWKAGIEIPALYRLGYSNNNCIGCVKGGIGYWNKIRKDFPERFWKMAEIERKVGATCLKDENGRIWLDELDPDRGDEVVPVAVECSIICQVEFENIKDPQTTLVMNGKVNINDTI